MSRGKGEVRGDPKGVPSIMSSSSLTSILTSSSSPPSLHRKSLTQFDSPSSSSSSKIIYGRNFRAFWDISVNAFSSSFFQGGFGTKYDLPNPHGSGITAVEDEEEPQCPPGLRQYETMAVLRSNMSEDERLALTNKYEESKDVFFNKNVNHLVIAMTLLVAGGGMHVEVFNRGIIPLAYSIKKKNKAGETNT
ncbi:unnamed protein product [Camellia sinensis]